MNRQIHPDAEYFRRLACKAGQIMLQNFEFGMTREWKADETPLTVTDTAINALVIESLRRDFPHVRVISEEGNHIVDDAEYTVFCDPVDGTIEFALGLPLSTFCISVVKQHLPLVAVIYDPFSKRLWHASRGEGSFLNDKPIFVSRHQTLRRSHIWVDWWKDSPYNLHIVCEHLIDAGAKWVSHGSIAAFGGLIASGQVEASIFPSQNGWETAAMQLIVEEAGGKVTDIHGNEMRYSIEGAIEGHITSNGIIHDDLVSLVRECQPVDVGNTGLSEKSFN